MTNERDNNDVHQGGNIFSNRVAQLKVITAQMKQNEENASLRAENTSIITSDR